MAAAFSRIAPASETKSSASPSCASRCRAKVPWPSWDKTNGAPPSKRVRRLIPVFVPFVSARGEDRSGGEVFACLFAHACCAT